MEFEELIRQVPDLILIVNQDGKITWVNDTITTVLGYTPEEVLDKSVEMLLPASMRGAHVSMRSQYIQHPSHRPMGMTNELFASNRSGELVPVEIELKPIEWNKARCVMAVVRSRTREKQKEELQQKLLRDSEERLKRSQAIAGIGTWDWGITENTLTWSDEIYRIFGVKPQQFGASYEAFLNFIHSDDRQMVINAVDQAINQNKPYRVSHRICRVDGSIRHVQENGRVYYNNQRQPVRMLGTVQDVTEQKNTENKLLLADTMFQNAYEGILTTDSELNIIAANPAVTRLTGFSHDSLTKRTILKLLSESNNPYSIRPILRSIHSSNRWRGELECHRYNASPFPALVSITGIRNGAEQASQFVITLIDISKIKENEEKLHYLAHYDQLTGLPNRTLFLKDFQQTLSLANKRNTHVALFYIDLDGFKEINDSQGHNVGDELLKEVSDRLRHLEERDLRIARLGGDEFALFQVGKSYEESQQLARKIIETLQINKNFNDYRLEVSASVGLTHSPQDGTDMLQLIKQADQAMYHAKDMGKNNFQNYDPEEGERLRNRLQLISDMHDAIQDQSFDLHIQPKYSQYNKGKIEGEALVRWQHPERGFISPLEFIPIAEETGQILSIGEIVLQKTCQFIQRWQTSNHLPIKIAVNLSSRQLHDDKLVNKIQKVLANHHITADTLEFEITESVVMEDTERNLYILEQLRQMGATIAIDDFGTGYSSLSQLKKLPVNILKIDRAFINRLPDDQDDCSIVSAIITMAHSLGLNVVAEGVETQIQKDYLNNLNCDQLQGYFLSKPMPTDQFLQHFLVKK